MATLHTMISIRVGIRVFHFLQLADKVTSQALAQMVETIKFRYSLSTSLIIARNTISVREIFREFMRVPKKYGPFESINKD